MLGCYILLVAIILILSKAFLFNSGSRKDEKRIIILTFILLIFVFGCRNGTYVYVSEDLHNYYNYYIKAIRSNNLVLFFSSTPDTERGYLMINWLLSRIVKWPQFIFFFEAAFCCGVTLRFIYKYSQNVLFAVLGFMSLGIMGFYMTAFRQSMAISVCLLALEMADKKKKIAFTILVLLAMSFHQTAIVFFPVYFIMRMKIDKLLMIAEIGFLLVIGKFVPYIIVLGNKIFHRNFGGSYTGSRLGGLINILIGIFIIGVTAYQLDGYRWFIYAKKKKTKEFFSLENRYSNFRFLYILILGVGVYAMRYEALILERISMYYTPVMFVMLPGSIENGFKEKDKRLLKIIFTIGMLFLIYWRMGQLRYVFF
nr:EpsG family protein [uncultured Schaedlerella sp.]